MSLTFVTRKLKTSKLEEEAEEEEEEDVEQPEQRDSDCVSFLKKILFWVLFFGFYYNFLNILLVYFCDMSNTL
jgi:hypothetical protein